VEINKIFKKKLPHLHPDKLGKDYTGSQEGSPEYVWFKKSEAIFRLYTQVKDFLVVERNLHTYKIFIYNERNLVKLINGEATDTDFDLNSVNSFCPDNSPAFIKALNAKIGYLFHNAPRPPPIPVSVPTPPPYRPPSSTGPAYAYPNKVYLVCDTCVWIKDWNFFAKNILHRWGTDILFVIPTAVNGELSGLKKSSDQTVKKNANSALDLINEIISQDEITYKPIYSKRILMQGPEEYLPINSKYYYSRK